MGTLNVVKALYSLALAVLLVLFVALGIQTFYPDPQAPPPPAPVRPIAPGIQPTPSPAEEKAQEEYQRRHQAWEEELATHRRNVFAIAGALGVAIIIAGLLLGERVDPLRPGLLLGGLFSIFYGVMRGANYVGTAPLFALVTLFLAALLYVGYRRLTERGPPTAPPL